MKKDKLCCVQKVRFVLSFAEVQSWADKPLQEVHLKGQVLPDDVRAFSRAFCTRLDRIASMMEVLSAEHRDWLIAGKRDCVVMETESFDYSQAIQLLANSGFDALEYLVEVEYRRKWGVL